MLVPAQLNLRFILPLSLLYLTIYLSADSVAFKIINFTKFTLPGPPFIFPLSYVIGAIISEVYGSSISKKIIWLTLTCQLIYALSVALIIRIPSHGNNVIEYAYNIVFGKIHFFVISGTLAVLSSSFVNVYLIAKSKILLNGKYFFLRNILSTSIGGFILVFVIVSSVYLPEVGYKKSLALFAYIYTFEFLYTASLAFPSWVVCGLLKKYEKIDVYDYDVKFNPFKFNGDRKYVQ